MKLDQVDLALDLQLPIEFSVVRADIDEALSEQTSATVEIAVTQDLDLGEAVEKEAVLRLVVAETTVRRWTLYLDRVDYLGPTKSSLRYRLSLRPRSWFMGYATDTRKYRNLSSKQIITQVLGEQGVAHRWSLLREPETRKYCVQYRETYLDFVARLLEFEGIYYTFDEDGTLAMGDASGSLPDINDTPMMQLIEASGAMGWQQRGLFRVAKGARVASGSATVNDYNWKKPKVSLLTSQGADRDAELEIYDYPVGYRRPDQGVRLAQHRLEALRVPARFIEGDGNSVDFAPGRHFVFEGQPRFDGRYLLQKVEHRFFNRKFDDDADGESHEGVAYRNAFHAIPEDVVFRPALVTAHPEIAGSHTAMVRGPEGEEIHTDEHGRFRGQFHWDREATGTDEDSRWLRNVQETQTGQVLARVGWEQSIAYVDGDPDRPLGFARNINGQMIPEYAQPVNKTKMTIKTPTYPNNGGFNELRLEDLAGAQQFDWRAEKDFLSMVNNNRLENVGGNETKSVGDSQDHGVNHDQTVTIGGNFEVEIGDLAPIAVDGNRNKEVGGNEKFDLGGNYGLATKADETETVTGTWDFEVGKDEAGAIGRVVRNDMKRTVSANHTITCKGNVSLRIEDELTETVTGSKITTVSDGGIGGTVTGKMTSAVTGNVTRVGQEGAGVGSENTAVTVTGATSYSSGEKLTIRGNHIRLESKIAMKLSAADLAIEMTPAQVAIKGQMKLESSSQIVTTGNPHNVSK